ncbi:MAG: class I SAM-dependent methyltransferase [Clostridiales bacterium]|jgi:tRNA (adenine22-N1)-methyltransferase|nr:class I SAM-dependent methyltransferase [Clostridiales bacterium]
MRDRALKPRLSVIADAIAEYGRQETIYDIGTDHAYMAIGMLQRELCDAVVATDARRGPLKKAERNVLARGLGGRIALGCGDGFAGIPDYRPGRVAVLSGMGGIAIAQIILDGGDMAKSASLLALQPMNNHALLRERLNGGGYVILREVHALEDRRAYVAMLCKWAGAREPYTRLDYLIGKRAGDRFAPAYAAYIKNVRARLKDRLDGLMAPDCQAGGAEAESAESLLRELDGAIAAAGIDINAV